MTAKEKVGGGGVGGRIREGLNREGVLNRAFTVFKHHLNS